MISPFRTLVVAAAVAALASAATACGSATNPTTSPGTVAPASHEPGPPGLDWTTAQVERPAGMDATPPSISPVGSNGGLGHPGHFSGQGNPYDLAAVGDRLIAVGYTFPDFHAVAWSATDRHTWSLADIDPGTDDAFAQAVAAGLPDGPTAGRVAVVGRIGTEAAAWTSGDGTTWARVASANAFHEPPETQMTTVVAGPRGFVAGGWAGISNQPGAGRFWASPDGRSWARLLTGDVHDPDGRIAAIARGPDGWVAVGHFLFGTQYGQGTAWTSHDGGRTWTRMPDEAVFGQGEPTAVIPDGPGYVATGTVGAPDNYIPTVWLSPSDR